MNFDTNLSLDLVITILAILGAVLRIEYVLEKELAETRRVLKSEFSKPIEERKAKNAELRSELKADNEALRSELKAEIAKSNRESKAENAELREDIRRVEDKVDESNQRIARLEGIILAREGMVDTIIE